MTPGRFVFVLVLGFLTWITLGLSLFNQPAAFWSALALAALCGVYLLATS